MPKKQIPSPAEVSVESIVQTELLERTKDPATVARLVQQGIHPLLASLFAARGVTDVSDVRGGIDTLIPIDQMKNARQMAGILADCVASRKRVLIVSDYDCDGATACSVLLTAFAACGMNHGYLVPERRKDGYGLTTSIVDQIAALPQRPDYIITVDNGVSSHEGVDKANALGFKVLITDHHLAPAKMPKAHLIVNPNQKGCSFPSKNIAGCGVAWYVARALLEELDRRGCQVDLDPRLLLTYVAIGTVADVVSLDRNNRMMVREGLECIRAGQCSPGVRALTLVSELQLEHLSCDDIAFKLAPRINAAGRLSHMSTGIEALTTSDPRRAMELAVRLEQINVERQAIQRAMIRECQPIVNAAVADAANDNIDGQSRSLIIYNPHWNEGVVGIVAGRLKDERHLPTVVFCKGEDGTVKGSGRSIPYFHLKHALDRINIEYPGVIEKFGGHGPAAGVTIAEHRLDDFKLAFEKICREEIEPEDLKKRVVHDGELPAHLLTKETIRMLDREVWGQGFAPPMFLDTVNVMGCKPMGKGDSKNEHLCISVAKQGVLFEVLAFGKGHMAKSLPNVITMAYKPQVKPYRGQEHLKLLLEYLPPAAPKPEPEPVAEAAAEAQTTIGERLGFRPPPRPTF